MFTTGVAFFGASSTLWKPSNLPNLYAWYKADSPLNTLSGSNYTTWKDLSGNSHDASISGTVSMVSGTIGGRSAASFTQNTDNVAVIASSVDILRNKNGFHFGSMLQQTYTGSSQGTLFQSDTNSSGFARVYIRYPNTSARTPAILGRRLDADSLSTVQSPTTVTTVSSLLVNINYSTATADLRANGTQLISDVFTSSGSTSNTSSAFNAAVGNQAGTSNSFGGYIGEVVICDAGLSLADEQRLEGYLNWQWGQQSSLPSGHPYKSAPPMI